ncbi:MAG: outer rane efflux protein [Acidobacteria bacterium]|jgi:outer membrane protein TolC|nr:outer rane efflux protein [Acidobacteriota bacterium]
MQQASAYQQALIDEQTAALDLAQSRAAILPKVRSLSTVTFNKPERGHPDTPAFIAANAVREYQSLVGVEGSLDFGLHAAVVKSRALLEAAHAGTEVARRALVRGLREAYYGYALASVKSQSADEALRAAEQFQHVTELLHGGGEVPEIDVIRARLQTAQRRDDLEQARTQAAIAGAGLRTLVGYPALQQFTVNELTQRPSAADLERFTPAMSAQQPALVAAEAQQRVARADVSVARAGRLPSLTYAVDEGFDAPSTHAADIRDHSGYLATATLNIPIFDWGIGRARQRQAELKVKAAGNQLALIRRDLQQQYLAAREEALSAVRRVDNARAAVEDAIRNVDISIARYRAGEAPILEVTDAETTLATQRANYMQALYDFEIARARLQEAAGE